MFPKFFVAVFVFAFTISSARSANILTIATLISPSHHIWNEAVFLGLVANGHNVTVLTHEKPSINVKNYTILHLNGTFEKKY